MSARAESSAFTSAPRSRRSLTASRWPKNEHQWSAVEPLKDHPSPVPRHDGQMMAHCAGEEATPHHRNMRTWRHDCGQQSSVQRGCQG